MDFNVLAKNWLAVHKNFEQFDYSIFTNSGILQSLYNDFCFYAAGYHGVPEHGILPVEQFSIISNFLTGGDNSELEAATVKKCYQDIGFKAADCGMLALDRTKGIKASTIKMQEALLQYILDPENLLIAAQLTGGGEMQLTLPQFLLYDRMNKVERTADELLGLNLIRFCRVNRTPQVYLIGSTFYSSLSEEECMEILHNVYCVILALVDNEFAGFAGDFTLLALNECTGKAKKSVEKSFLRQIVKANALGFSLNQIMNCLGLNIPDVMYSIKEYGMPTAINENGEGIQFVEANAKRRLSDDDLPNIDQVISKKNTIRVTESVSKIVKFEGTVELFVDKDKFLEMFGGNNEPRKIRIS